MARAALLVLAVLLVAGVAELLHGFADRTWDELTPRERVLLGLAPVLGIVGLVLIALLQ